MVSVDNYYQLFATSSKQDDVSHCVTIHASRQGLVTAAEHGIFVFLHPSSGAIYATGAGN
jgi:hypothetical protein